MSHVEKRGPKRWLAVPSSGKNSKSFPRKVDAERYLAVMDAALLKGDWIDPRDGYETFHDFASRWVEVRDIRDTTRAKYVNDVKCAGALAAVPLSRITPAVLEQWQSAMLKTHKRSTVITVRATFNAVLAGAVRDRLIVANPFGPLDTLKPERKRVKLLTTTQILTVRDTITPWYRAAVDVGRFCGWRPGEIFGLTADRIDFKSKLIHVDQQLIYTKELGLHLGPPKTPASVRTTPMTDDVSKSLATHILRYGLSEHGLVFHTWTGAPVAESVRADAWNRVTRQKVNPVAPGSKWHWLRHFAASAMIAQGASVLEVMEFLGHATAKETTDTYGHLWPGSEDRTRARMAAVWADPPPELHEGHNTV